ncbi:hypothetical protein [Nocardiopsis ansamitocini]|uniref:WD40 repeat domain-containing protein n=1 Tax=Nocardiopsis ansamitocini TaxID=1670832 RepID=A0A9W6UGG8_9ACTN|nr:hypothetical protein [Nocardiopsis ansamitocini]GLU47446.1 hypothetical protein Nans01_17970 [Nocardiopsis ansamitocini]
MTRSAAARWVAALALLPAVLGAAPAQNATPEPDPSAAESLPPGTERAFTITDPRIAESSGLAASVRHENVYWTHNDSGPQYGPDIYAVNDQGETLATVRLVGEGVEARDWEAIALGTDDSGEPALYVADIGDNFQGGWPSVRVYRLPEPAELVDQTIQATTFTFGYADGGRDAEGILVDPRDNRLYVVSKEIGGSVYAAPEQLDATGTNTLTRVGPAPLFATDAAFSPDGSQYAIRTYWGAVLYDASDGVPGPSTDRIQLPTSDQGESLTYTRDGTALLVGTEGEQSPVWRIPLAEPVEPAEPTAEPGAEQSSAPESDTRDEPAQPVGAGVFILGGAVLAAIVIAGIVWLARTG